VNGTVPDNGDPVKAATGGGGLIPTVILSTETITASNLSQRKTCFDMNRVISSI
jgi:hypothetical protein